MKIQKILVPVDFSALSEAAARHAVTLGKQFGAKVVLTHVYFPEMYRYFGGIEGGSYVAQIIPPREEALADSRQDLEELASRVDGGAEVKLEILEGEPAAEIVGYAQEHEVDLIVMPTRGHGPFRQFILGSVTAKVLHDSQCPVFTCPHGADLAVAAPEPYRKIACAVDLGPHSEKVIRWAGEFAKATGGEVAVIHAAPSIEVGGMDMGLEVRGEILNRANLEISTLLEEAGVSADIFADCYDPLDYVPRVAEGIGANVLVIGRTTKEGLLGQLRANTYALIRQSPCPVVSI
jgi:nucleotide-binding universal stress UspA family protein